MVEQGVAADGCEPVRPAESALEDCQVQVSCTARISAIPVRSLPSSEGCDWPRRTSSCWHGRADGLQTYGYNALTCKDVADPWYLAAYSP